MSFYLIHSLNLPSGRGTHQDGLDGVESAAEDIVCVALQSAQALPAGNFPQLQRVVIGRCGEISVPVLPADVTQPLMMSAQTAQACH